ncbi:hypothetical protein A2U01_0048497, partial [Trifolium medium]|nr:hypothetical protein [Trifolium medium]
MEGCWFSRQCVVFAAASGGGWILVLESLLRRIQQCFGAICNGGSCGVLLLRRWLGVIFGVVVVVLLL